MRISDWSSDVCSSDLERLAHMGVRIDEAGRDDQPGRVDRARRGPGRLGADVGDAVAADRDVAAKGRGLAAIDGAAAQDQVGAAIGLRGPRRYHRSEEHTSELQSLMRNSYAVFC